MAAISLSESTQSLGSALTRFERFNELASEEKSIAIERLTHTLSKHGRESVLHAATIDAHRELTALLKEKSLPACEALLRLIWSEQRANISNFTDTLEDCLLLLKEALDRPIEQGEISVLCNILNTFKLVVVEIRPDEIFVTKFAEVCLQYFKVASATIAAYGITPNESRKRRSFVEEACYNALLGVSVAIDNSERVGFLCNELIGIGESRYMVDASKLPSTVIDKFESETVTVDLFSLVVLALVQLNPRQAERVHLAHTIAQVIVSKCAEQSELERDKERCKALFSWVKQLVNDVVAVLRAPEWPCAELLLVAFVDYLYPLADKGSRASAQTLAAHLLSTIAIKLEKDFTERQMTFTAPSSEIVLPEEANTTSPTKKGEIIACPCGTIEGSRVLLDCNRCHRWFHATCVGIDEMAGDLKERQINYLCVDCTVIDELEATERNKEQGLVTPTRDTSRLSRNNSDKAKESPSRLMNDPIAKQQKLIRDQLRFQFNKTKDPLFVTAMRCYADEAEDLQDLLEETSAAALATQIKNCLTRAGASRLARIIAQDQVGNPDRLFPRRDELLQMLVSTARSAKSPNARSAALEGIGEMLEVNKSLLDKPLLIGAVQASMNDESVKVRETCLQSIISKLEAASRGGSQYVDVIIQSMDDTGASVRKRAIELACKHLANSERSGSILTKLSLRLEDSTESSVIDIIKKSFMEFVRGYPPSTVAEAFCQVSRAESLATLLKVAQEDLTSSGSASTLTSAKRSSSREEATPSTKTLESILGAVMDKLTHQTRKSPSSAEATNGVVSITSSSCLRAIKAFCKVDPILVEPHLGTLRTLIAPDPKPQKDDAVEICDIFAMSRLDTLDAERRRSLAANLSAVITGNHPITLPYAVRALAKLQFVDKDIRDLEVLVVKFLELLEAMIASKMSDVQKRPDIIQRALYGVGLIGRYQYPLPSGVPERIAEMIRRFARIQSKDANDERRFCVPIRKRSVQAAGLFLIRYHKCHLQGILHGALEDSSVEVRESALLAMLEILIGAKESGNDHNESVLTNFVLEKVKEVKRQMLGNDGICRKAATRIIQALLDRGQIHPQQCFPELVALQRDPDCQDLAYSILLQQFKAKTSLTEDHLHAGIAISKPFVSGVNGGESLVTPDCFNDCYKDFVMTLGTRQKYSFLQKMATLPFTKEMEKDFNKCAFVCGVISALPYNKANEVLFIYDAIRKQALLQETNIRATLEPILGPSLKAMKKGEPIDQEAIVSDPLALQEVRASLKIALIVDLCVHLKQSYRLTSAQLARFDNKPPTEKDEKSMPDVTITKVDLYKPSFDLKMAESALKSNKTVVLADKVFRCLLLAMKSYSDSESLAREGSRGSLGSSQRSTKIPRIVDPDDSDYEGETNSASNSSLVRTGSSKKKKMQRMSSSSSSLARGSFRQDDTAEYMPDRQAHNASPTTPEASNVDIARSERLSKKAKMDFLSLDQGVSPNLPSS